MTRASKGPREGENEENTTTPSQPIARKAPRSRSASVDANMAGTSVTNSAPVHEELEINDENNVETQVTESQQSTRNSKGKASKKGPRPRMWTEEKENRLIEMYKERRFMYNLKDAGYHNRNKKAAALKYMAQELKVTGK